MEQQILWIVTGFGVIVLGGVFWRMKGGFGPFNLRVVAIVLVAILASLLGLVNESALNGAIGILGAIAGYVFGINGQGQTRE